MSLVIYLKNRALCLVLFVRPINMKNRIGRPKDSLKCQVNYAFDLIRNHLYLKCGHSLFLDTFLEKTVD